MIEYDFSPAGVEAQAVAVQLAITADSAAATITALEGALPWLADLREQHSGAHAEAIGVILVALATTDASRIQFAIGQWSGLVIGEAPEPGRGWGWG